jgi:hypothetical protein
MAGRPPIQGPGRNGLYKQLGVGGVLAIAVLWITYQFLVDVGAVGASGDSSMNMRMDRTMEQISELHDWHDVKDPRTGQPVWLGARQTELLEELVELSREQTTTMRLFLEERRGNNSR